MYLSMVKLERNTRTVAIITVLIVLIIVRLLTTDTGGTKWIELINIAGLLIAIFALLNDVYLECKEYEKTPLVIGTIFFMLIIVCIIGTLIFTRTITPSQRANDIIMLITLLVSLPSHFYVRLIKHYVSK